MLDPRFGATHVDCGLCYHSQEKCPGHPGFLELPVPVYNPIFLDQVLKVVRCVCYWCGGFLAKDYTVKNEAKRLAEFSAHCKGKACPECEGVQPKYSKAGFTIRTTWPPKGDDEVRTERMEKAMQEPFSAKRALLMLKHMSEGALEALRFTEKTQPKDFIFQNFPLLPASVRPSVTLGKQIGHDELTHKSQDIVKVANQIAAAGAGKPLVDLLTSNVWALLYKDVNPKKKNGGRSGAIKSLAQRIVGKDGQIRKNMMGKRCNNSARSVIGPDARIDVDQVGLPMKIVLNQTIPERCTPFNLSRLRKKVRVGYKRLGGAKCIVRKTGKVVYLEFVDLEKAANGLKVGDTVERYLEDGDVVAVNRQPSLHKGSMMGHRVKVMAEGDTIRLNLACCKSYNADFDGDEMNVHVPQTVEARADLENVMAVKNQIVSPGTNRPVIACCQDTLISAYRLTRKDCFLTKEALFNLSMNVEYPDAPLEFDEPAIVWPRRLWTGKQAVSYLLPKRLGLEKNGVLVRGGRLLKGQLCKKTIGAVENGLVHTCLKYVGTERCVRMLSDLQRLCTDFLSTEGFSIGIGDCIDPAEEAIERKIDSSVKRGTFQSLQGALQVCGKVTIDRLDVRTNSLLQCVMSGAKGSSINIAQIAGLVGQQTVGGGRVEGLLPGFSEKDGGAARHGFIPNSYVLGLTPTEFYHHAMSGREGIIDTSCKTSTSGYFQRKIAKFLESLTADYDGSVRNEDGQLVQFLYGGDGYDASKLERVGDRRLPIDARKLWETRNGWEGPLASIERVTDPHVRESAALMGPSLPESFLEELNGAIECAKVCKGEPVGLIAATSIGEPATQLTLNSFHHCGVGEKQVTHGIPRINELINVSKTMETPSMDVHPGAGIDLKDFAYATVGDVVLSQDDEAEAEGEEEALARLVGEAIPRGPVLVVRLKKEAMLARSLEPLDLVGLFPDASHVLASEPGMDKWALKVRGQARNPLDPSLVLQGKTKTVTGARWQGGRVVTDGTDLRFALSYEGADATKTVSNFPSEVYELLGVEAAREVLRREVENVLQFDGNYINRRHVALLADTMCFPGWIKAVSRHGMAKDQSTGVLKKASFEEPIEVFRRAAVNNEVDHALDVTSSVFFGLPPRVGTGTVRFAESPERVHLAAERKKVPERNAAQPVWDFLTDPSALVQYQGQEDDEGYDDEEDIYGALPVRSPKDPAVVVQHTSFEYDDACDDNGFFPDTPPEEEGFVPMTPPHSPMYDDEDAF